MKRRSLKKYCVMAWIIPAVIFAFLPCRAAFASSDFPTNIEQLEERVRFLEHALEIKKIDDKHKDEGRVRVGERGFLMESSDGDYSLDIFGALQLDSHNFTSANSKEDDFVVRRMRPMIQGRFAEVFSFRFSPEFGLPTARVFDAYVEYLPSSAFNIRMGKSKMPIDMERFQNYRNLRFPERALVDNLVPTRDVGVSMYGSLPGFDYNIGVFNGVQDRGNENGDTNSDKTLMWRFFTQPFQSASLPPVLRGVGIGFGGSWTTEGSSILPTYRTSALDNFFQYRPTTSANGEHYRLSPHTYYHYGSFGVMGEWVQSSQEFATAGGARAMLNTRAWQAAASYILTGEDASLDRVAPRRRFDWRKGTWGAFEVAGRIHELKLDERAFPLFADPARAARRAEAFGLALNWYLNYNLRLTISYEETRFTDGNLLGRDRPAEKGVMSRMQVAF